MGKAAAPPGAQVTHHGRGVHTIDGTLPARITWTTAHRASDELWKFLSTMAPLGQCYVHRVLEVHMKAHLDFEAACGDFGMRHLPVDITPGTVFDEMGVRKARGTPAHRAAPALWTHCQGRRPTRGSRYTAGASPGPRRAWPRPPPREQGVPT